MAVALLAGGIVPLAPARRAPADAILLFDAAGLGLFAVAGTQKALAPAPTRSRPRHSGC